MHKKQRQEEKQQESVVAATATAQVPARSYLSAAASAVSDQSSARAGTAGTRVVKTVQAGPLTLSIPARLVAQVNTASQAVEHEHLEGYGEGGFQAWSINRRTRRPFISNPSDEIIDFIAQEHGVTHLEVRALLWGMSESESPSPENCVDYRAIQAIANYSGTTSAGKSAIMSPLARALPELFPREQRTAQFRRLGLNYKDKEGPAQGPSRPPGGASKKSSGRKPEGARDLDVYVGKETGVKRGGSATGGDIPEQPGGPRPRESGLGLSTRSTLTDEDLAPGRGAPAATTSVSRTGAPALQVGGSVSSREAMLAAGTKSSLTFEEGLRTHEVTEADRARAAPPPRPKRVRKTKAKIQSDRYDKAIRTLEEDELVRKAEELGARNLGTNQAVRIGLIGVDDPSIRSEVSSVLKTGDRRIAMNADCERSVRSWCRFYNDLAGVEYDPLMSDPAIPEAEKMARFLAWRLSRVKNRETEWQDSRIKTWLRSCGASVSFLESEQYKLAAKRLIKPRTTTSILAMKEKNHQAPLPICGILAILSEYGQLPEERPWPQLGTKNFRLFFRFFMTAVAIMYMFGFGVRPSQVTMNKADRIAEGRDHNIRVRDVHFVFVEGSGDSHTLTSREVYSMERGDTECRQEWMSWDHLDEIRFSHHTTKTTGASAPTLVHSMQKGQTEYRDRLMKMLFAFSQHTGHESLDEYFFTSPGDSWNGTPCRRKLQPNDTSDMIKWAARLFGLAVEHFANRSLRIGVAIVAAAIGISFMKIMGLWSSGCWRIYHRNIEQQRCLGDKAGAFTVEQVRRSLPLVSQHTLPSLPINPQNIEWAKGGVISGDEDALRGIAELAEVDSIEDLFKQGDDMIPEEEESPSPVPSEDEGDPEHTIAIRDFSVELTEYAERLVSEKLQHGATEDFCTDLPSPPGWSAVIVGRMLKEKAAEYPIGFERLKQSDGIMSLLPVRPQLLSVPVPIRHLGGRTSVYHPHLFIHSTKESWAAIRRVDMASSEVVLPELTIAQQELLHPHRDLFIADMGTDGTYASQVWDNPQRDYPITDKLKMAEWADHLIGPASKYKQTGAYWGIRFSSFPSIPADRVFWNPVVTQDLREVFLLCTRVDYPAGGREGARYVIPDCEFRGGFASPLEAWTYVWFDLDISVQEHPSRAEGFRGGYGHDIRGPSNMLNIEKAQGKRFAYYAIKSAYRLRDGQEVVNTITTDSVYWQTLMISDGAEGKEFTSYEEAAAYIGRDPPARSIPSAAPRKRKATSPAKPLSAPSSSADPKAGPAKLSSLSAAEGEDENEDEDEEEESEEEEFLDRYSQMEEFDNK